ncbi:SGNH/GDSL hydrolase family protein [Sinomonas sp. ASV486]|uniref:SGNH/GDSL hydrolase family protein n=1 Tax=Sinomonas sp. ASV486 TaxID=3051170 RepID=UPI0027DBA77A|nr:SGNH/GDSL hydrolase family protein [Sinomonas sp. ASV486]MDQ4492012.1 SGNH/GDSL hydrolase family protein [Sinomonas sp. ASV486]
MSHTSRTASPITRGVTALVAAISLVAGVSALPATATPPPPVNYVNLGDSYSAGWGAGAPEVNPNYSAPVCYGSGPDHVTLLSALMSVNLVGDFACAGATLAPGASYPSIPDQIRVAVNKGALTTSTGLVTLTGGGNDLGFVGLLEQCGALKQSGQSCVTLFHNGAEAAPTVVTPLVARVAAQIRDAAENARIAWLGYPHLFAVAGQPTTILPGDGFLTNDEAVALNEAADALNSSIKDGLKGVKNAQFANVVPKFDGHELGSSAPWITPLVLNPADPGYIFNLHPTATGYAEGYYPVAVRQVKPAQIPQAAKL